MILKMNLILRSVGVAVLLSSPLAWVGHAHGASSDGSAASSTAANTAATQAEALIAGIRSGALLALPDEALIAAFTQIHPQTLPTYLQLGVKPFNEYEVWMRREERLADGWPSHPFLNHIKYRHQPRQIYMKWLKDSPKSGQEIIYDETRRKDAMLGHMGGIFNITSIWTALDSPTARSNSRHSIRDLGMQFMVDTIVQENRQRTAEGVSTAPTRVEVTTFQGERCVALTWRHRRASATAMPIG
jgi:hypothetical protein